MSDISKCKGGNCPLADKCWRYLAPAEPLYQSYLEEGWDDKTRECPHFWNNTPPPFDKDRSEKHKTILEEAREVTDGARQSDYGDAEESFDRICSILKAFDILIDPYDIPIILIAIKLVRESYSHKRDNLVDICGYARLYSILKGDEA